MFATTAIGPAAAAPSEVCTAKVTFGATDDAAAAAAFTGADAAAEGKNVTKGTGNQEKTKVSKMPERSERDCATAHTSCHWLFPRLLPTKAETHSRRGRNTSRCRSAKRSFWGSHRASCVIGSGARLLQRLSCIFGPLTLAHDLELFLLRLLWPRCRLAFLSRIVISVPRLPSFLEHRGPPLIHVLLLYDVHRLSYVKVA